MAAVLLCEVLGSTQMLPFISSVSRFVKGVVGVFSGLMIIALAGLSACWAGGFQSVEAVLSADLNQWSLAIMSFFACWLFAAIVMPLEYAVHTLRPVLSSLLQLVLYSASVVFRVLSSLSIELGRLSLCLYDAVIFIPLYIEKRIQASQGQAVAGSMEMVNAEPQPAIEPTTVTYNEQEIEGSNVTQIDFNTVSKKSGL
jgi:hypothetical protein